MIIYGRPINVEINQLLDAVAVAVKEKTGVDYFMRRDPTPNDIVVQCPRYDYHGGRAERTPSCFISREDGLVHCFGCEYKTTVVGMIKDLLELKDVVEALQWIRKRFSSPAPAQRKSLLSSNTQRDVSKCFIPEEALLQYNYDHPYMFKRKLTPEAIDWFSIGYDPERDALTIPMRDIDGNISFIKKRPLRGGFGKYLIEEGADKREILFGMFMVKRCLSRVDKIYISEGEIDVLSWYCVEKYGVGLQGSEIFPEQVKQLIRVARGKEIVLALDNDTAGAKAKKACIEALLPYFRLSEIVYPGPNYKDPNDLLKAGLLDKVKERPVGINM